MPITSPRMLKSGPPELPGLMATSVWMKGTKFSCGSERPFALTIPAVTVFSKPNGEPMATSGGCAGSCRRIDAEAVEHIVVRQMHHAVRRAQRHIGPRTVDRHRVRRPRDIERDAQRVEQHRHLEQVHQIAVWQRYFARHVRRFAIAEV